MKAFLLFTFTCSATFLIAQFQVGETIFSSESGDQFGRQMELSEDGKRVIISSPNSDELINYGGFVRIYDEIDNEWNQVFELKGKDLGAQLGRRTVLSEDGTRFAASGHVADSNYLVIYKEKDGLFNMEDDTLFLEDRIEDLAFSKDAKRLAIGAITTTEIVNTGVVHIYEFNNEQWELQDLSIYGEPGGITFGNRIDISGDGKRIIIAEKEFSGELKEEGKVIIYEQEGEAWNQVGQAIIGDHSYNYVGNQVEISENGNIIAINYKRDLNSTDDKSSKVLVFSLIENEWTQMGQTIRGTKELSSIGLGLDLSASGHDLIIGETSYGEEYHSGKAIHYRFTNNEWVESQVAIFGEIHHDNLGTEVSISRDGNRFAASAARFQGSYSYVKVYEYPSTTSVHEADASIHFDLYPNPTNSSFTIESELKTKEAILTIFDQLGSKIYSTQIDKPKLNIDLQLAAGMYFIQLSEKQSSSVKNLVVLE